MNQQELNDWRTDCKIGIIILLLACLAFIFAGCSTYQPGEAKTVRSTTLGLKIKMFGEVVDASPVVLYLGWNEVEFTHGLNAEIEMDSTHTDINLWKASGNIGRSTITKGNHNGITGGQAEADKRD